LASPGFFGKECAGHTIARAGAMSEAETSEEKLDFIREIVAADLASNRHEGVVTRFPPEPN